MSFTNYTPQISWKCHDTSMKRGLAGAKAAAMESAKITLPGSLKGGVLMMDIPSRDSINTDTRKPADKRSAIMRGGL
jgi:hypothetical protein